MHTIKCSYHIVIHHDAWYNGIKNSPGKTESICLIDTRDYIFMLLNG